MVVVDVADRGEVSSMSGPWPMPRSGTLLTIVPELSREGEPALAEADLGGRELQRDQAGRRAAPARPRSPA